MKDGSILQKLFVALYFLAGQHDIRAGLSVEREISVAVRELLHKGKRRRNGLVHLEAAHINALPCRFILQHSAEHVVADFADKRGAVAKPGKHRKHITGRTSGIRLINGISLRALSAAGKINKQLTQCRYRIFSVLFHTVPHQIR